MLYLSIKKVTNNCYKIIAQSRCCQYVVKFSKELSLTQCLNFLKKIIFSVNTNPDFVHLTHVKASYYPLFMTSMLVLIKFLSKAFDKVWHEGLLFKLENIGISGNLLSLLKIFLNNRFQRVVLNGQCSN